MASSAAAISNGSSSAPLKDYEVFISFRGEDTRANFTSHLHAALCRNGIETYIDYRIDKGGEVWAELERAIRDSTLFLVIFSENYASSTWCLNELLELMDCKNKDEEGVDVIPVFYRIEPSIVRKQSGSYERAFAKHWKDRKLRKEKIPMWKNALSQAANLSGFHSQAYRTEFDMIEDIIKIVLQKLDHKYTNDLRGLFIYDENYTSVESLVKADSKEVRVIGIWGMGGIGKTTLAAAVFQMASSQYDGTCFLENVTEESKRHGLNYVCNQLLSKLLREDLHIDTPKVISSFVTRRLRRMKVFIVLDDVNTLELLESLVGVGRDWLGAGSRVIVTTRDKHVLISGGVDKTHEVKEMNFPNSLRLFCVNAFNKTVPKQGYEQLSEKAVAYARGVPLALKVLGSFLHSKSKKEWESALSKLKEIPNPEVQKVLRLSYDKLDDTEKNIFLDIACFFKGQGSKNVTRILNDFGFFADIGIRNLLDKGLINITSYGCLNMHDLIQEMGRKIVREESIRNPGQRSRLWDPEEVYDVLTKDRGTGAIQGIWIDMNQIAHKNLSSEAFKKMPNLRLLAFQTVNEDLVRINCVYLPKGLELSSRNLRYLCWNRYPLKSLPSAFYPSKLNETLSMPYNNVEKLSNGIQNLQSLEKNDLKESPCPIECPNLCHDVDSSSLALKKLVGLDVSECKSLKSLSGSTCSPFLQRFYAWSCFNHQVFAPMPPTNPTTTRFSLCLNGSSCNEAIKEREVIHDNSITYNPKLSFKFFAQNQNNEEVMIKECKFRWMYPSVDQIVKDGKFKSKRNREVHEIGATAIQNTAKGSDSDEQKETVPSIEKFKQRVFGTPSYLQVEETEKLRRLLEQLLHIGFGGDFM